MRRADEMPIDPEMAAYLDAIDATLAGEPVDPRHAEIAELALLLADERPRPDPEFAAALDVRAARRFAPARPAPGSPADQARRRSSGRRWRLAGQWSAVAACAAALVVAIVLIGNGSVPSSSSSSSAASSAGPAVAAGSSAAASGSAGADQSGAERAPSTNLDAHAPSAKTLGASSSASSGASGSASAASAAAPSAQNLSLPPNGRKTVQSAELDLTTKPTQIEQVAQEVFNVVGDANGIVDHSAVTQTGGSDGSASFELRLPSSDLGATLGRLSSLRGAQVVSRTDNSQDVNSQYVSANRQLADDQALHTALLKQLAAASTQTQIDSLKAQIRNVEASITSDQNALRQLNSQIAYSRVTLNISAGATPAPVTHHSSGFTLGGAAHTAGRVLVVAAGVGLIVLAGLVPVALITALLIWAAALTRRRRREQALDVA